MLCCELRWDAWTQEATSLSTMAVNNPSWTLMYDGGCVAGLAMWTLSGLFIYPPIFVSIHLSILAIQSSLFMTFITCSLSIVYVLSTVVYLDYIFRLFCLFHLLLFWYQIISIYLSIYRSIYLSIYLPIYLSIYQSIYLSASIHPSIHLSIHPSTCIPTKSCFLHPDLKCLVLQSCCFFFRICSTLYVKPFFLYEDICVKTSRTSRPYYEARSPWRKRKLRRLRPLCLRPTCPKRHQGMKPESFGLTPDEPANQRAEPSSHPDIIGKIWQKSKQDGTKMKRGSKDLDLLKGICTCFNMVNHHLNFMGKF